MILTNEEKKILIKNDLFIGLTQKQQEEFFNILTRESFKVDEYIISEGDKSDKIYIIQKGTVKVIKQLKGSKSEDEQIIATLGMGDTIGEVALLDKQPRSASVKACEAVEVLVFYSSELDKLSDDAVNTSTKIKLNLARRLSQYLRTTNVKTVTERKKHSSELNHVKYYDVITGLPNENLLIKRMNEIKEKNSSHFSLGIIEISDLKDIKNSLGDEVADDFLCLIGDQLQQSIPGAEIIARIGKDQFGIVYTADEVNKIPTRCIRLFSKPFFVNDAAITSQINMGVASYPKDATDPNELIKLAELALDSAKIDQTTNCCIYDKSMNERVANRRKLFNEMNEALEKGQFILYYQPQTRLIDDKVIAAEALIRWNHPVRGMVSPGEFIPAAEQSDFILKLGHWILKEACAQAKIWETNPVHPIRVAVNLSTKQFLQKNFIRDVKQVIDASGVNPKYIELEITESLMMDDIEATVAKIKQLSDMGIILALDDFGTGYSSLSYLTRLPVDKLKVDQSFVKGIDQGNDSKNIIRAIISLAKSLNMQTLAEGVEEKVHAEFLKMVECDEAQGYYYSKPISVNDFEQRYLEG